MEDGFHYYPVMYGSIMDEKPYFTKFPVVKYS